MNPTILEASDDLTNLSHLNEPAGTCFLGMVALSVSCRGAIGWGVHLS